MRKLILLLALVFGLALAFGVTRAGADHGPLHGHVIALDAGHSESASDVGAINTIGGTTIYEKDVNWDVVVSAKAKLEALGATVALTRGENEFVDRPTRYQRAADAGAEVLVSVHHNGSTDPTINYTVTFFTQKSDERIARLAQNHLVAQLGFPDSGIRRNAFGMTVKPKMPSALTEAWFLTNDALAAQYLADPASLIGPESQGLADAAFEYLTTPASKPGKQR
ncbi:MAG: N-acetylmuramoyl-L-alanine amidase [Chloroflexi bacterium]|nr:N-acetylmuramoyl-L-alanine amidase [Chloroflexota bacterium]